MLPPNDTLTAKIDIIRQKPLHQHQTWLLNEHPCTFEYMNKYAAKTELQHTFTHRVQVYICSPITISCL